MESIIINKKEFKKYDDMYYVSADGEIYSTYCKKPLKQSKDHDGYWRVDIHSKHMKVHKMVYLTWIGSIPDGLQINHKDDNKNNNHWTNLYVGTQKENITDCIKNNHRVGNMFYLTLFDKEKNKTITFVPASDFIGYSGHSCNNGRINRMFSRNWFKKRYHIIDYKRLNNIDELEGVTTKSDECSSVG